MRAAALLVLACALTLVPAGTPAGAGKLPEPDVTCSSCVIVDDLGRILWAHDAHARLPNASTTKMVTALEAINSVDDPKETATVSAAAGSVGGGGLDLQAGDEMTVRNLLFAMLLSSSNEAAATLAEHVGGTQEAFVRRMNARVRALGLKDTHFANPHGLDATGHYSSAFDLAQIGAEVLANDYLRGIVSTPETTIDTPRGPVVEQNRNVLLEGYPGALGIKTGRTLGAGNVLVGAARRGDRRIIAVAMHSVDATNDTARMLDYGFARAAKLDRPRATTVLEDGTAIGSLIFDPYGAVGIVAEEPVTVDLVGQPESVDYVFDPDDVSPPLEAGEEVGTVSVIVDGEELAEADVVVMDEVGDAGSNVVPNFLGAVLETVAAAVNVIT